MIIKTKQANAITSNDFESHDFKIGDPVLILDLLRNRLYKNPIRIAVQEYVANAKDAHIEDEQFDTAIAITAPSHFEPEFSVEDFGKSMNPEQIANIFTQYGVSTKRSSDNFTGGFGIGSKSGWSYTDSYNVRTRTKESGKLIERNYCAYIDDSGIGKISLINEKKLKSGNTGTKISIPVKTEDIYRFVNEINQLNEYFNYPVSITGMEVNARKEITRKGEISFYDSHHGEELVIVNGIRYSYNRIEFKDAYKKYGPSFDLITRHKMIPCFNTEDIDVSPDRSNIQMNKKNAEAIYKWEQQFCDEAKKEVATEIEELDTAAALYNRYSRFFVGYQKEIIGQIFEERYTDVKIKDINKVMEHVEVVQGKMFDEKPHYFGWQVDPSSVPNQDSVILQKAQGGSRWDSMTVAAIREVLGHVVDLKKPPRTSGGAGVCAYRYNYYGRRKFPKVNVANFDDYSYYIVRTSQGDYTMGGKEFFTNDILRNMPKMNEVLFITKKHEDFLKKCGLVSYDEYLKEHAENIMEAQYNKSTKQYEYYRNEGLDYNMRDYSEKIPEIKAFLKKWSNRKENHKDIDRFMHHGFIDESKFTTVKLAFDDTAVMKKYPMLFLNRVTYEERQKLIEKYIAENK